MAEPGFRDGVFHAHSGSDEFVNMEHAVENRPFASVMDAQGASRPLVVDGAVRIEHHAHEGKTIQGATVYARPIT